MSLLLGRFIEALIRIVVLVLGRRVERSSAPWLLGPLGTAPRVGGDYYEDLAARHGLELRIDVSAGLLADCSALDGPGFDAARLDPAVRHFYEHTAEYQLDIWSQWSPLFALFGRALILFVSRRMEQLNLPVAPLEVSHGMTSKVIQLADHRDGRVLLTGWLRRLKLTGHVVYAGFYSAVRPPGYESACVKVVFPVPDGGVTVLLAPTIDPDGSLRLTSSGQRFGDPGYYRLVTAGPDRVRAWNVRSFRELFHVYCDSEGVLRTDHLFTMMGLEVVRLHYRMTRAAEPSRHRRTRL